jgi:hypothetical protein
VSLCRYFMSCFNTVYTNNKCNFLSVLYSLCSWLFAVGVLRSRSLVHKFVVKRKKGRWTKHHIYLEGTPWYSNAYVLANFSILGGVL